MLNNVLNCKITISTSLDTTDRDLTITSAVLIDHCNQGSYPMNGRAGRAKFVNTRLQF